MLFSEELGARTALVRDDHARTRSEPTRRTGSVVCASRRGWYHNGEHILAVRGRGVLAHHVSTRTPCPALSHLERDDPRARAHGAGHAPGTCRTSASGTLRRAHVFLNCSLTESFCIATVRRRAAGAWQVAMQRGGGPRCSPPTCCSSPSRSRRRSSPRSARPSRRSRARFAERKRKANEDEASSRRTGARRFESESGASPRRLSTRVREMCTAGTTSRRGWRRCTRGRTPRGTP